MLSVFVFASLPARGKPADNPFSIINSSLREALTARIPTDKSLPFIFLFLHSAFVILFPARSLLAYLLQQQPERGVFALGNDLLLHTYAEKHLQHAVTVEKFGQYAHFFIAAVRLVNQRKHIQSQIHHTVRPYCSGRSAENPASGSTGCSTTGKCRGIGVILRIMP